LVMGVLMMQLLNLLPHNLPVSGSTSDSFYGKVEGHE
jgi:hypothetical protein